MSTTMERFKELQPDSAGRLERAREAARAEAPDAELLELCLGRMDAMLTGAPWEEPAALTARERAYLDFAEQFSLAVGSLSAAQVGSLLDHDSEEDVCRFVGALYPLEMSRRIEIVGGEVLR